MRTGARSLLGGRANFRPEIVVGSRSPCLAFSENMGFFLQSPQKAISEFLNLFTSPRPVHDPILQVGTRPLAQTLPAAPREGGCGGKKVGYP
jgi:hypothetical protein